MSLIVTLMIGFGCAFGQEWVQTSEGEIPDNALVAGTDTDDLVLYVCRAYFQTETCVGKVNAKLRTCRIPYFDEEHEVSTYEVLTSPPWEEYTLEWSDRMYGNGDVPENAVPADSGVFVGRLKWNGHFIPGKIVQKTNAFYYGYDGVEYRSDDYMVLLKETLSVDHYELHNVEYYLDEVLLDLSPDQVTLSQKTVTNDSPYDTTSVLSMAFTDTKTSDWSQMNGIEIQRGGRISVTAKIPYVDISGEFSWGSTRSASYTQGGSYETSETTTHEVTVNLPAYSNVNVAMLAKKGTATIPYEGILRIFFTNREGYKQVDIEGIYEGVQYTSFETSIKSSPLETDGNGVVKQVSISSLWMAALFLSFSMCIFFP